jgi:hypothetical protein
MKKQILFIVLLLSFSALAQNGGMNYKALITNNNNALSNHNVTIKFTILQNGTTSVYQETQTATTDANGIVAVNIGEGTTVSGNFNTIDWGADAYFLKVEINTGSGYTNFGTSELKYVPYAKYADKAGNTFSGDYNDLSNTPSVFYKIGGGGGVATDIDDDIRHSGKLRLGDYSGINYSGQLIVENYDDVLAQSKVGGVFIINSLSGGGSSDNNIGIYSHLTGDDNAFQYGIINAIDNTGLYPKYGVFNTLTGSSNSENYGVYSKIDNSGNKRQYGSYNELLGTGTGNQYGVKTEIRNSADARHYGSYNYLSGSGSGEHKGVFNRLHGDGTGNQYGVKTEITNSGNATHYGSYNELS